MASAFKFIRALRIDVYYSRKCSGKFRVAETKLNHRSKNGDVQGDNESGGKVDENRSTEIVDEEVMSPASYVTTFVWTQVVGNNIRHRQTNGTITRDDDGAHKQFFRRIHIICRNNVVA